MEIILIAVLIIGFIYLNARINTLDGKINYLYSGKVSEEKLVVASEVAQAASIAGASSTSSSPDWAALQEKPTTIESSGLKPQPKRIDEEIGGRWLGKIGVIALVVGMSFFLKYAFENNWIGETGRVMIGIFVGLVLLGLGQYLRKKYLTYSDVLMGGGIAVLYLSIFGAFSFYSLISMPAAFFLMACITVLSVVISLVNSTVNLAALGVFGGFITPFLIMPGDDQMMFLFSYVLMLDLGILALSAFRKWIPLNYLGFIGTIATFFAWFSRFYAPDRLGGTMFFLTSFFVVFLFSSIIHNIYNRKKSDGSDLAMITINAAGYSWMSYFLLEPKYDSYLGFFALGLSVLYFVIAYLANKHNPSDKILNVYLPGVAVVFLSLAIPLQFSGHWITLAWLIEAVVLCYVAFSTNRDSLQSFGVIVYAVGLVRFFVADAFNYRLSDYTIIFNRQMFLLAVAVAVAYAISYLLVKKSPETGKQAVIVFVVVANLLTLYGITYETHLYYQKQVNEISQIKQQELNQGINYGKVRSDSSRVSLSYEARRALKNKENTATSIFWALYAVILVAVGLVRRVRAARLLGMILLFVTAVKIFINVWELGQIYRIVSSISFGVIALAVSFAYAKYKHVIKEIL